MTLFQKRLNLSTDVCVFQKGLCGLCRLANTLTFFEISFCPVVLCWIVFGGSWGGSSVGLPVLRRAALICSIDSWLGALKHDKKWFSCAPVVVLWSLWNRSALDVNDMVMSVCLLVAVFLSSCMSLFPRVVLEHHHVQFGVLFMSRECGHQDIKVESDSVKKAPKSIQ